MKFDEGRNFKAELLKIQKMIFEIRELGFDTTKIELIVQKIQDEIKEPIDTICEKYNSKESFDNLFKEDYIANYYREDFKNLVILEQKLTDEYNIYSEIHGGLLVIESNIKNIDKNNLSSTIELMISTLKKIKTSSTINYEEKEFLVEKTYQLSYELIKIELFHTNNSNLLNFILMDEFDTIYTEKYLKKELETIDFQKEEYKFISNRIKQLKEKGLKSNYLDLELLIYTTNPKFINAKKELITTTYDLLEEEKYKVSDLTKEITKLKEKITKYKRKKSSFKREIIKQGGIIACWLAVISGTVFGFGSVAKKFATNKYYYTVTETYDVNKDEFNKTEVYQTEIENSIEIIKYFPYQKTKESNYYIREVHIYDVSDLNYDNIKDYTTINLEEFYLNPQIDYQTKSNLESSDLYKEPKILIKQTNTDKNNVIEKTNKTTFWLLILLFNMCPLTVELLGFYLCVLKDDDDIYNRESSTISKLKEAIQDYIYNKEEIKELFQELSLSDSELKKYLQSQSQLLSLIEENYHALPTMLTQEPKLIKIKKKIKSINDKF